MTNELSLLELLQLLKKNWWQTLLSGVIVSIIAFIVTETMITPKYQSTVKMVILNKTDDVNITYSDIQISNQLVKDSMEIVKNRQIMENVVNDLHLPMTPSALNGMVSVSSPTGTRIVELTVTDTNPERARDIAESLYRYSKEAIISSLDANAVNMFESPMVNLSPVSPNLRNNCIIGAFFGMALYVAVLVISFMANTKIVTPEDVEEKLKVTLLATIPYNELSDESKKSKANRRKHTGERSKV